jgi:hypothetical protein
MKILCNRFSNAPFFIFSGWKNVFERLGCEWHWLQPDKIFDQFNSVQPDIYIGTTYELNRPIIKCIAARSNLKVVLKANNWGPLDKEIDPKEYPIGISASQEQDLICQLRREIGKPDYVFNFYHKNCMQETMSYWDNMGVPSLDMQTAADVFSYYPVEKSEALSCDIAFVGGYWPYKGVNLNKYIVPLCYPVGRYNIKIFGNQIWPVQQYMGAISLDNERSLYSSAAVCANISEPHANRFGFEVNERVFKLAACKAFVVSDKIESLTRDIFKQDELVWADDPEHFYDLVDMFVKNPALRVEHIEKCYQTVMCSETYCHRVAHLLDVLGYQELAGKAVELLKDLTNE